MPMFNVFYSVFLLLAGATCLLAAVTTWPLRDRAQTARRLALFLGALAWWDFTYALFWAGVTAPTPYFWLDLTYLGAVTVPAALFVFALRFAGPVLRHPALTRWSRLPHALWLAVEPALVTLILWTDPSHGLFFGGERTANATLIRTGGPVFWINAVYSYLLILAAFGLLLLAYRRYQGLFRQQAAFLLAAAAIPWVSNLVFLSGLVSLPDADPTPFTFTVTGLAFAYALMRFHLLDVVPIARHTLIEKMSDGVVVLDQQDRVVDVNPAARQVLGLEGDSAIGRPLAQIFERWPNLMEELQQTREAEIEVGISGPPPAHYSLRITPIFDARTHLRGRLIVWRDITALKQAQAELHHLSITDSLTQVFNRRHFLEMAQLELERCLRYQHDMAIIMIDLDHFKRINDRFGHLTGDRLLAHFARTCQEVIRVNDIFARLGGEEFVLLLPESGAIQAYQTAERLQKAVENMPFEVDGEKIKITISIGIATLFGGGDSVEKILRRADQALYRAKNAGRNRIVDSQ